MRGWRLWVAVAIASAIAGCGGKVPKIDENYVGTPEWEMSAEKGGHSLAPVLGYEPTFKFVAGGAYFYKSPTIFFGLDANWNFGDVYQAHLNLSHEFQRKWIYQVYGSIVRGFDPYYGEGGETDPANYKQIWAEWTQERIELRHQLSKTFAVGMVAYYKGRRETSRNPSRFFPDESSGALGLISRFDSRDNDENPRNGFLFSLEAYGVPRALTSESREFIQSEASLVIYKGILEEISDNVVAAFRLMGGTTFGDNPSYMYKFRLGGTDYLIGYLENRFRGKTYYLQQSEVRFPIWKLFSGAAFLGFGDATDSSKFTNPKVSYGAGVRIALPPDWVSRVRIDFGYGRDQHGIFADFGHTF